MSRRIGPVVVVLVAGVALGAQAPTPQQTPPVFRTGTTVVPLTVTVLDEKGAPVRDLTEADFTVYENKRLREIVNFYPQKFEPGPVDPIPTTPLHRLRDDRVTPQTRRTFLIVLGYGRIQHPTKALDGAIDLVRKRLLPQDAVAVMGFHRTTSFTTDHEQIAQILERYKKSHEKIVFEIGEYLVFSRNGGSGGAPIPEKLLNRIDEIFVGAGPRPAAATSIAIRRSADLLLGMDRSVPVVDKPGQVRETFADLQRRLQNSGDELNDAVLMSTRLKLYAGVEYLRYLDGEKHMIFFAGGGLARNADDAELVAKRATDARVVVDLVATNGTNLRGGGGSPSGRVVAELTGGYYTSVEMAAKAVAKIDETTRFSYLLGYTPSNPTLDGRYREVEVKVNRPGLTVRYRHGYFAAAEPEPLVLKELIVKSRLEAALAYDSEAKDIKVGVTASLLPRMGIRSQARVEITIDAKPLALPLKDGIRSGQLELQVYCGDAKHQVIGDFGERLDLEATEDIYAQWLKSGIRRIVRVPAVGTPKYLKVVVYDYGSDRVGSAMVTLKER